MAQLKPPADFDIAGTYHILVKGNSTLVYEWTGKSWSLPGSGYGIKPSKMARDGWVYANVCDGVYRDDVKVILDINEPIRKILCYGLCRFSPFPFSIFHAENIRMKVERMLIDNGFNSIALFTTAAPCTLRNPCGSITLSAIDSNGTYQAEVVISPKRI